jgi:hypothetical protein
MRWPPRPLLCQRLSILTSSEQIYLSHTVENAINFRSFGLGATSTPISATNRNPFGSITPTTAAQGASPASGGLFGTSASGSLGSSAFGTPASTFGTPNRSSAFGSFGTGASAASPPSTGAT